MVRVGPKRWILLFAVALLAGCSQESVVPGDPGPQQGQGGGQQYQILGYPVSPASWWKLTLAGEVRKIDPCGLIDIPKVAGAQTVLASGPYLSYDECEVAVLEPNGSATGLVSVNMADMPLPGAETITLAGEKVDRTKDRNNKCAYRVPLRVPAPEGQPPAGDDARTTPYVKVYAGGYPAIERNCAIAEQVATTVITLGRDNKLPKRAQARLQVPLAERNPCELAKSVTGQFQVSAIQAEYEIEPYECTLQVTGPGTGGSAFKYDLVKVDYQVTPSMDAMTPLSSEKREQVDGYPVLVSERRSVIAGKPPECTVKFAVGGVVDAIIPGVAFNPARAGSRIEHSRHQVLVRLSGPCPSARAVLPAGLSTFGANR